MDNNSLIPLGRNTPPSLVSTLIMACLSPYFEKKRIEEQVKLIEQNMKLISSAKSEIMRTINNMSANGTLTPIYFDRLMDTYNSLSFSLNM